MRERPPSEKQASWDAKMLEIESWADDTGHGVDEGIKETVAAFNLLNMPTVQSCEGHSNMEESHSMWPWVQIAAPGEPAERYVGEAASIESMARERGLNLEDLKRGVPASDHWDAIKNLKKEDTPEYVAWCKENKTLEEKARAMLDAFYAEHATEPNRKLVILRTAEGFEVTTLEDEDRDAGFRYKEGNLSEEELSAIIAKLPGRQEEMLQFTEFLKRKYFEGETQ